MSHSAKGYKPSSSPVSRNICFQDVSFSEFLVKVFINFIGGKIKGSKSLPSCSLIFKGNIYVEKAFIRPAL